MPFCNLCNEHTKTIYKNDLQIVNLTADYLKSISVDQLTNIYKAIKDGITVCKECKKMCDLFSNDPSECSAKDKEAWKGNFPNIGAYHLRIIANERDIEKIKKEIERRENIKKVLKR